MIKFFRKIRQKLLSENKFSKYLLYAIGEIVLVVIGILIALQINDWNEQRKNQDKYQSIYTSVYADIENDLNDLQTNRDFFLQKKPVFERVLNDSITPDLLDLGLSRLLAHGTKTSLNTSGINQLRELENKDSLALAIIDVYDRMRTQLLSAEVRVTTDITEHSKYVRDNYEWYGEWISKTIMKDNSSDALQNYFLRGIDYRNRVIYAYQQLYNSYNYIPSVNYFIERLTQLKPEIQNVLSKSND
ncbi:DUF6090 family protein [Hyunsoonleella rubra]|uniref:DUF6090 family protein n=1 Tax=Hyunsoonleella rubra TaxID=1737062 RepID=A0ABW5T9K1_9FLAO